MNEWTAYREHNRGIWFARVGGVIVGWLVGRSVGQECSHWLPSSGPCMLIIAHTHI